MILHLSRPKSVSKFFVNSVLITFFSIWASSCVFHPVGDLNVTFVNNSSNKYFVGESYDCDPCEIDFAVRYYCSGTHDQHLFPQIILPGESITMTTKLFNYEKAFAINADSLDEYCNNTNGYAISRQKWVKLFRKNNLDENNKTCTFTIK
ncbi:hypothetical protein CJD36_016905 [Flavipsychrobacter stenotrophus]|uniref:Lipoprotein n=1 Tax=Flavipsychrobacter stenotrophus TaxID=2077091 RepID=A0A2S7SSC6_9BACT|nr:hypothetical protein CJD36_016905 [Flavipsychrobacter stenotrophus]